MHHDKQAQGTYSDAHMRCMRMCMHNIHVVPRAVHGNCTYCLSALHETLYMLHDTHRTLHVARRALPRASSESTCNLDAAYQPHSGTSTHAERNPQSNQMVHPGPAIAETTRYNTPQRMHTMLCHIIPDPPLQTKRYERVDKVYRLCSDLGPRCHGIKGVGARRRRPSRDNYLQKVRGNLEGVAAAMASADLTQV